jgi:hypothetical protein
MFPVMIADGGLAAEPLVEDASTSRNPLAAQGTVVFGLKSGVLSIIMWRWGVVVFGSQVSDSASLPVAMLSHAYEEIGAEWSPRKVIFARLAVGGGPCGWVCG